MEYYCNFVMPHLICYILPLFLLQIMTSNTSPIVLASMLILLAVVLDAKSLQHRYRHMRDISFEDSENESNEWSFNLSQGAPGRYNQNDRKRRGFARWNVPQQE